jgi:O-antigen/teichoic acid export membrane protein
MTRIRNNALWAAAGNGLYLACQYGILMSIAKMGTTAAVGEFALALAVTAPIIILSQMQLRQLQVTDVAGEAGFGDYLWSRVAASMLAVLAILVIGQVAFSGPSRLIIWLVAAAKGFESVSDVFHGRLQRMERLDLVAVSMVARGVLSVAAVVALLSAGASLTSAVAAMAVVSIAVLLALDLPMQRLTAPAEPLLAARARIARRLLRTAFPLAVASGLISLSGNLPRYLLDALEGKEAVALFSVAAIPLVLVSQFSGAVAQAVLPRSATLFQTGHAEQFRRLAVLLTAVQVAFAAGCAILLSFIGEPLIVALFTPEYAAAAPLMVIMFAGAALGGFGAFGTLVLSAGRHFMAQLWNVVFMVVLQLVVCYALINRMGVAGAAWAELIRYSAAAAFLCCVGVFLYRANFRVGGKHDLGLAAAAAGRPRSWF